MDTYRRTIILCLVYVIVDVNGQQVGGGLAIPWGQGVSINMADFDPFANLRGRRKPEPHAVIMDPHDPFRPKVAPESPYVGGSSAGGWSKERDFSSYSSSISSSNEASSSTKFGAQPTSRPHDSGGVAISLTGPLPGNNTVNEHNSSRFADSAWWNQNINASALNVSMYPVINSTGNESMYNDAYNALNMSMYPDAYNESMYADAYNAYNESMYADAYNAYNESMYANAYNAYNESMYADAYNAYNESMYADAYNAFNDSMYADAYSASNMSMYPDNNTSVSLESSAYSRESINNSALYDSYVRDGKLSADFIPNETLNDTFASSNETFDSANSQIVSNHIAAIGDRTNVEHDIASGVDRTDNAFIANTAKVTNGLFVPETIGKLNMRFDNSIDTKVQNSNHDRNTIAGTFSSQASGTSQDPNQLEQGVGNEMLSPFYDNVNDKLSALNRMHHVSSNNIEVTRGDVSVHHNRSPNAIDLSPPPAIQVPASWANGVNNASEPVFTADGSANQLPDFDPFRRSQDTRYDVKETPAATNVNVPDTPTVRNVAKPTTGMGVPISFGVNLPDVTAEDPFMVGKFVEVPMDQGKRPTVVSGVGGSNMIVENKPKTVDIATSQQESFRIDSSNTNQVSTVDVQAPAVGPVPNIQQRVRQEPDLPFSRQPIIETQPAVDFMSSFLSQPIDPTRRGNGQKTVDTQTDISIVPLESQQTVSEPAQTLAQDAKSRDWRSFISTFLMGGGPGLEQMGHASFGPMDNTGLSGIGGQSQSSFTGSNTNLDASSQGQMSSSSTSQADIGSQGQMNVLASGSTDRQMDVSGMGSMDRQMDVSGMSSMDSQMGVSGTLSTESQMGVTGMRPMDRQMDVSGMRSMDSQMGVSGTRSIDSQMDVSGMRSMDNQMNMAGTRSIDSQMDVSGTRSMDNQMNMAGTRSMDRQMGVSGTPSMGSQMDASGTPSMGSSQMDVSRPVSMDRQAVGDLSRSQNQISDISTGLSSNLVQDKMYGSKPQLTDTITDQTSGQYAGQMENQLLSSIDTYKRASLDQSNGLSQGQIQEPRIVTADQSAPKEVKMADSTLIDSNPLVIDLTSSGIPADNVIPTGGVQASGINVGLDVGANTQYDIAQNTQGQMENVVGLSETRPMDMPQAAEVTGVSTKVSPFDASSSDSASALDLGLSDKPLTSFEGASPSDLQKLKLLEVAQRLLLQERGIQDPQAGSQTQTFTPLGMTGGLDSILSSLNQGNNMGEMIRSSLNQGSSQTLGMTSAQFADIASTKTSKENTPITKLADTTPKKNFQLGEWSSGVPVGTGGQDSVPIGNIFAGRFLQSGTELPLVGGTAVSPTAGIPIGQSLASKVLSTLSASTSGESATTGSRGGGLIIKDKLPISFQRPCNAVRDPASKYHFYRTVGAGRIRFRCALGTAFDDGTCECSIRVVSSGDCLEVFMNFNTGQVEDVSPNQLPVGNMNVEITNRTAAYPGIAVFDGNAKLTIWRYQNYDFRDHVMLKLRFRPGVGGNRYQTILANCDGSPDGPSIAIVFDKQVNELIMILRTTTNNDKNLRFKIDPNRWSEVTYLYDGDSFIGLVNNDRQSMPMKGLVEISDEALVLGHCPRFGNYNGAIDDVKIYTCIPKENRFLL